MTAARASTRQYSGRTIKILWGRSAGRCSFAECRKELLLDDSNYDPVVIIGDIAHVEASSDRGPRSNPNRGTRNRDNYNNLILLCKNCHARIDGQKRKFKRSTIQTIKSDHEMWVRSSLPESGLSKTKWSVIILEGHHPIDRRDAINALSPDSSASAPVLVQAFPGRETWQTIHQRISTSITRAFARCDPFARRFAVFPLAPVSSCIALGYQLTDRPRVKLFQYHRQRQSWQWSTSNRAMKSIKVIGLPRKVNRKKGEIIICFEISASVETSQMRGLGLNQLGVIRFQVSQPSTSWLREECQLEELGEKARETFEAILRMYPSAKCWHLLVATPAPIAVKIGQSLNPTMTPPVQLYEFVSSTTPQYLPSIRLPGGSK